MGTPAPDTLLRLVDRFDQDRKVFVSADYKEEQLRLEFPDYTFRIGGRSLTVRAVAVL